MRSLTLPLRMLAALVAGAIAVLGMAPFNLWPVLIVALAAYYLLIDGALTRRRPLWAATATGWSFGFGYMAAGLYWIGEAFFVDPDTIWLMPFAVTLLPAGMAIYFALSAWLFAALGARGGAGALWLTATVCLGEFVRGFLFTGFPWNLFGATLIDTAAAQGAALVGVYGLTIVVALLGFGLGAALRRGPARFVPGIAGLALLAGCFGFGMMRAPPPAEAAMPLVRIVQPNAPESEKNLPDYGRRLWQRLRELSTAPAARLPDVILWPEGVTPFFLDETPEALQAIGAMLAPGQTLILGSPRRTTGSNGRHYYNSLFVVGDDGAVIDTYDKTHLVPFGEFMPLPGFFRSLGIASLTARVGGSFTSGPGLRTLRAGAVPPFSPLICYEALFPAEVVAAGERPRWLVNITDDSWFGTQTGPHQHLTAARFRAIEEGLPLARSATTGISAMIDAQGRVLAETPLQSAQFIDIDLPSAYATTSFARYGHIGFMALLALAGLGGVSLRRSRFSKGRDNS